MKGKIFKNIMIIMTLFVLFPTFIEAANHQHTDKCYKETAHVHTNECYIDANAGGCGGELTWTKTSNGYSMCANNDGGSYEYTMYTATCAGCGKTYTDTVYGPCSVCSMVLVPMDEGTTYPKYESKKCSYQVGGESLMVTSCLKEEGKYYNEDGTFATPICSKVIVSITPVKPNQTGSEVDCSLNVVYLDGNTGVVTGTSDFDSEKKYSSSPVTLIYEGLVGDAKTTGKLYATVKLTTPFINTSTPIPENPNIPTQPTFVPPTKYPTNVPNTNQSNTGNRIDTGNGFNVNSGNNNNGGSYYNGNKTNQTNKFSGSGSTRGESVAQTNANKTPTPTITPTETLTPTPTPRESVKVKITRPLTKEEKESKIDSSMVLTKLLRNEENDVVGVKEIKENKTEVKKETIVNGEVNKGNAENNKGKVMVYVLLIVVFVAMAGLGAFILIQKKKEDDITTNSIDLQDSLML